MKRAVLTHLVTWGALTNYHEPAGLKQQKSLLSHFGKLEVQNEDFGKAILPLKALGKYLSLLLPSF